MQCQQGLAIRHVQPREAELIARRGPDTVARLYATPDYLDRIGRPEEEAVLAWLAGQGAVLVFMGIVVLYAWCMNRAEARSAPPEQKDD